MKTTMRKAVRLGLVVGLAVTGLVGVTSLTAAGTGERPMVSYGTLTLNLTDRAGSLTFVRAPGFGGGTFTQALGVATPCSTLISGPIVGPGTPPAGVNLLNFDAAVDGGFAPNVQLPSNSIGVTDGANCGEPSGLVGPGETLTLALGGFLPTDVVVSTGTLQIGKSRGSDGNLLVAYDGANFGTATIGVAVGGEAITVADADGKFKSISIRSTASQSSRGLSLRSNTVLTLVAPAPATVPGAPTRCRLSAATRTGHRLVGLPHSTMADRPSPATSSSYRATASTPTDGRRSRRQQRHRANRDRTHQRHGVRLPSRSDQRRRHGRIHRIQLRDTGNGPRCSDRCHGCQRQPWTGHRLVDCSTRQWWVGHHRLPARQSAHGARGADTGPSFSTTATSPSQP